MPEKKDKGFYRYPMEFKTKAARDEFKNYVHSIKVGKGIPIYQTLNEMLELHKEKHKKK